MSWKVHLFPEVEQGTIFPAGVQVFPTGILQIPQEILTKTLVIKQILVFFYRILTKYAPKTGLKSVWNMF